jgi:1-deoxyxylulose-5-phosphate synthase
MVLFTSRRPLGRIGFVATPLGIGDLADRQIPLETCVATARRAIDAGLNVIDTAPSYEDGYSEMIVGRAVKGVREKLFVISKIDAHDDAVAPQIEGSLGRLGLDHTDAFVFHGLSDLAKWKKIASPGGGMDELAACVKAGKTRFRGISSHNPDVLAEAIPSGLCDLVLFPVGPFVDERYVTQILPLAKKYNVGTVCFKTFGAGKLLGDTSGYQRALANRPRGKLSSGGTDEAAPTLPRLSVEDCLHYTLTHDPDVTLLGLSFPNEQDAAWSAFRAFTAPKSKEWLADVKRRAVAARAEKGPCWWNPNPDI